MLCFSLQKAELYYTYKINVLVMKAYKRLTQNEKYTNF